MVTFTDPGPGSDGDRYVCPYCDYAGQRDSVRAHIRGKTDDRHRGKSGFEDESEPVPADGSAPVSSRTDTERAPDPDNESGMATAAVFAAITFLLWLAQRTGNEDEIRKRINRPR
jgi:hypothetical protein